MTLAITLPFVGAEAQSCELKARSVPLPPLPDGRTVTVGTAAVVPAGDRVGLFGTPVVAWDLENPVNHGYLGAMLRGSAHLTLIPAPAGHESAMYARALPRGAGWEVVYFVPTPSASEIGNPTTLDGDLWAGYFDGRRWLQRRRVAHVDRANVLPGLTSGLERVGGKLQFAITTLTTSGGAVVRYREREGGWEAESLHTPLPALSVTSGPAITGGRRASVYYVAPRAGFGIDAAGPLFEAGNYPDGPGTILLPGIDRMVGQPHVFALRQSRLVTWWEERSRAAPARILAREFSPGAAPAAPPITIGEGTTEVRAASVRVAGEPAVLWLYRKGSETDTLRAAAFVRGQRLAVAPLAIRNQAHFALSAGPDGAAYLISATLPTPGTAERPVSVLTRLDLDCARGQSTALP